ncbi:P27 family phage terminase small subunit [Nonomuraea sp. NPDC049709]|uniref:phage terminase small subunit n=1 Tax=Nonomuraea sp. NPDC049709 TaxID=3154736 RepID=UPI003441921A
MAGRGPAPKDPEERQRRNAPKNLELVMPGAELQAAEDDGHPAAPDYLLPMTKERWATYWTSPVAKLVDAVSDLPALERLFWLYDDLERSRQAVAETGHVIKGSKGQTVMNPLLRHMQTQAAETRQLEDRFGLSPRARLSLNLTLGQAAQSLADLNAPFLDAGGDDDDPRDDPRLDVVDAEVVDDAG